MLSSPSCPARVTSVIALHPVALEDQDQVREILQQDRRLHQALELLAQAEVARVEDDEAVGEPERLGHRVPLRLGAEDGAIRPVVNDRHLARVGPLSVDQPPRHRLAHGDDGRRLPEQHSIHAVEGPVDALAPEVVEEPGHLREDVLAQEDERHPPASGPGKRRQPEDRRIREAHHDVGASRAPRRDRRREEVRDVVRGPSGEPRLGKPGPRPAQDRHAPHDLATDRPRGPAAPVERHRGWPGDDRHRPPVPGHEILAQLGQELTGRPEVGVVGAVEDQEMRHPTGLPPWPSRRRGCRGPARPSRFAGSSRAPRPADARSARSR